MWDNAEAMGRLTRWLLVIVAVLLALSGFVWFYNSNYLPVKQVSLRVIWFIPIKKNWAFWQKNIFMEIY